MPAVFVRRNDAWTEVADPKRIYVRRTRMVAGSPITEWDPISSLFVRNGETWTTEPRTWSPATPTGLLVPADKRNIYTSTYLQWNTVSGATGYKVRQTQWKSDLSGPTVNGVSEGLMASQPGTTNMYIIDHGLQNTFFTYEVAAIGANGLESDFSDPYQYKTGVPAVMVYDPVYGWANYQSGATNWHTVANTGIWDNAYVAQRATDSRGWNEGNWGYLPDSGWLKRPLSGAISVGGIAAGRNDIIGDRAAYPYNACLHIYPSKRVKLSMFQIGHVCVMGYKNIFNFTAYSRGHQEYQFEHHRSNGTLVGTFAGPFGVDGNWPGHTSWIDQYGSWNQPTNCHADVNGVAGDYITIRILEAPPVSLGTAWNDGQIPYSIPNIRFLWFWWHEWSQVGSNPRQISAAVPGKSPW